MTESEMAKEDGHRPIAGSSADEVESFWQLGHRRPWWNFNVLTLFAALFVLVWLRYLFSLSQPAAMSLTVLVVIGWLLLGSILQPAPAAPAGFLPSPEGLPPTRDAPLHVWNLHEVPAFTTKDGSEIRELLAYRNSCVRRQSLAEARLPAGASTTPHYHPRTEEIYYILSGSGTMRLEAHVRPVGPGDAIPIPPGARHQITNTGSELLTFLCCCVPAYEHADTILVDDWPRENAVGV